MVLSLYKMKKNILIIILLVITTACKVETISIEDLDISGVEIKHDISISGFITSESSYCYVDLFKPTAINDAVGRMEIADAIATVKDGINVYPFDFIVVNSQNKKGTYISREKIQGVIGRTYTLEIVYNGKVYTASDVMPDIGDDFKFPIESVEPATAPPDMSWNGNGDFFYVNCTRHNFGFENAMIYSYNLKLYGEGSNSWANRDIKHVMEGGKLYNHRGTMPQGLFPSKQYVSFIYGVMEDSVQIIKMAISDAYYSHLISMFNETDWRSGLFSTVSSNVETNVSKGGIGFFYATSIKRKLMTLGELSDTKR